MITARAVVNSILDTLSNNDFVTILQYNNETDHVVPCFEDKLIQATPENLDTFREYMKDLDPLENANLTNAFTRAFGILKSYRETRGCGPETPCNQLIMLVTDNVASNISEVIINHNSYHYHYNYIIVTFLYDRSRDSFYLMNHILIYFYIRLLIFYQLYHWLLFLLLFI